MGLAMVKPFKHKTTLWKSRKSRDNPLQDRHPDVVEQRHFLFPFVHAEAKLMLLSGFQTTFSTHIGILCGQIPHYEYNGHQRGVKRRRKRGRRGGRGRKKKNLQRSDMLELEECDIPTKVDGVKSISQTLDTEIGRTQLGLASDGHENDIAKHESFSSAQEELISQIDYNFYPMPDETESKENEQDSGHSHKKKSKVDKEDSHQICEGQVQEAVDYSFYAPENISGHAWFN